MSVDRNWEKLHSRVLASYARAILRIETISNQVRADLVMISMPGTGSVVNPDFNERISKQELSKQDFASEMMHLTIM
ncbi:hypothetical protein THRCLA_22137 [Thraustotheca clavata]|uniref:Uncharacterized protein n=1 Tax=Thraustotheca clavata TaxID=74557 RepID=A0A1V9ZC15_9STRA|nr:hypothetical protein THRCLA_22137 [Thraustotheca clavata]